MCLLRIVRNSALRMFNPMDPFQGEEISGGRHPTLQLLKVQMLSLPNLTAHDPGHKRHPQIAVTHLKTHRKLPNPVRRLRQIKKRDNDPKRAQRRHQARPRPLMLNPHHRHLSFPKSRSD